MRMLKLYKKFKPLDWVFLVIILGLTVLQVYCTMTMVDYIKDLVTAINLLPYNMADASDIWRYGGLMVAIAFGGSATQAVIAVLASYIAANMGTNIRKDLNDKISSFSLGELNKFSTASLITRATNDVQNVQMTNLMLMRMVFAAPVTAIWAIVKVQEASWQFTVATAVAVVILVIGLVTIMVFAIPKFNAMQKLTDRINGIVQENLTGIRVVHAYNAEKYQEEKFNKANTNLTRTQLFTGRVTALLSPLMMLIMNGLTLAIYWIGAFLISGESTFTGQNEMLGTLMSFASLAGQIVMAFMMLLMMFVMLPRAEVCAKRINEVLETEDSIKDPAHEIIADPEIKGEIEFQDVSFRYPDAEEDILEHISFTAHRGDTIAFIGSTGSGKSTLVNLVTRLYDVTEGHILVDGVDVKDMKQNTLRHKVGFVPQRGLLFSGTIRSNVGFGVKGNLSDEEVQEACRIACADEFIEKMDQKYDSPIAQGGTNVSGGQRQRLCIARAVATKPEIFVFDDSFSALDFKTDKKVRDNLRDSQKEATKLIVAQRIGTIMDADQIVVLSDGKMVGKGTHKELLQNCEIYREIALSQLSKEELGL